MKTTQPLIAQEWNVWIRLAAAAGVAALIAALLPSLPPPAGAANDDLTLAEVSYDVGLGDPRDAVTGDVTGNGHDDLIVANQGSREVSVVEGDGNGRFGDVQNYDLGTWGKGVTVADFNGSGATDVAVTLPRKDRVAVLLNKGDGTLRSPTHFAVSPLKSDETAPVYRPQEPKALTAGDFTGNGHTDLATANGKKASISGLTSPPAANGTPRSDSVSVLEGDGTGDFALAGYHQLSVVNSTSPEYNQIQRFGGTEPIDIVAADLTGNGRLDLATANRHAENVSVLPNIDGSFGPAAHYPVWDWPSPNGRVQDIGYHAVIPRSLVAEDLNGNGRIDLAVSATATKGWEPIQQPDKRETGVSVLKNTGQDGVAEGLFEVPATVYPTGDRARSLSITDITGNGELDAAVGGDGELAILEGHADASFTAPVAAYAVSDDRYEPSTIVSVELTDKEYPALAAPDLDSGDVSVISSLGWIHGTVEDSDGDPIADADITVDDGDGSTWHDTTGTDGTYLVGLGPYVYSVTADHDDYNRDTVGDVDVTPGNTITVNFQLTQ